MPKVLKLLFTCIWFLILSTGVALPQSHIGVLLYQKDGAADNDELGFSVAGVGDVSGDGRADFIVGASQAAPGGLTLAGSAYVYSGADGSLLYQKDGAMFDRFGFSVAGAGDVNGDGKADFIIGAIGADPNGIPNAGSAYLYSGADGSLLYQKDGVAADDQLGDRVAGAGDVDGDGKADFIIGDRYADPGGLDGAGSVYLYSGADGSLLYQKNGAAANDELGASVTGAGDINKDGRADFIIGAPAADPAGPQAGSAYIYSGSDGSLLYQKDGFDGDQLGRSVASAGDVNGDGNADFIIGAPFASPNEAFFAGSAYLYSGSDGSLLFQKDGVMRSSTFATEVASAGDVDGDGKADFIIGEFFAMPGGRTGAGSVYLYSGATGTLLYQKDGEEYEDFLGFSVASAGDVNGDGKADFIIGAPQIASASGAGGLAYVYSLCSAAKGDMNGDESFAPADVVLILNCNFLGTGNCGLCFADVDCDGNLTLSDVVNELNFVFLNIPPPC